MGIDFDIRKSRFGLYTSYRVDNGEGMTTALTLDACYINTTQIHIPSVLGTFEGYTSQTKKSTAVEL